MIHRFDGVCESDWWSKDASVRLEALKPAWRGGCGGRVSEVPEIYIHRYYLNIYKGLLPHPHDRF
jgi:hypothetical protein